MAGRVRRQKFLDEGLVQALLAATDGELLARRDRALLGLIYAGGLRVGEVARLDIDRILWGDEGVVVLGKKWRPRFVPIALVVLEWVADYLDDRMAGPVFLADHGGPMSPRLIRKVVDKYARKAASPKISPHTLRHSCASHMLVHGMYLPDLSRFLGHKRLATTTVYLHEVPKKEGMGEQYRACHPLAGSEA